MSLTAVLALAVALAMDAFAVAVATGLRLGGASIRQTFRLAFHFGLFQALMPIIGWILGLKARDFIAAWDHWVAFGLLALVGGNMIREFFREEKEEEPNEVGSIRGDPTRGFSLVLLSTATSIDALAVGLSFAVIGVQVWGPAVLIGLVCCGLSAVGLCLGGRLGRLQTLGTYAGLAGGLVLLGIGVHILWEHDVFTG